MKKYKNCEGCPDKDYCLYLYNRSVEWCDKWENGGTTISTTETIPYFNHIENDPKKTYKNDSEITNIVNNTYSMFLMNRIKR